MNKNQKEKRRQHNADIATCRIDGKFVLDGDPRGGGDRSIVIDQTVFYWATMVSLDEIWARLGLTDTPRSFEEMTPAVEQLPMEILKTCDRNGRPLTYGRIIYNPDGTIRSSEVWPI